MILPLVVIIASAAAVSAGIYLTIRGFKASAARAAAADGNGHAPGDAADAPASRHDQTTIDQLKRFFDGKQCALCKRDIPPVQRTGLKPGLQNPTTRQTYSWDRIPHDNLPAILETHSPLCPTCQVAESFRERHPDLVVDRDRSHGGAQPPDRIPARS